MTVTVDAEDKSVQKPPVIMQEVLLYYEKQTVPRFSVALAVKNKTPFDRIRMRSGNCIKIKRRTNNE